MPGGWPTMKYRLLPVAILALCLVLVTPALAQENPYQNAGEVSALDIPVPLEAGGMKSAGSSDVVFSGAGYTHTIGRVSVTMEPLDVKGDGKATVNGNVRRYRSSGTVVEHEVYRDLVKERVILNAPTTLRYSYALALSDWVTVETDESRPVEFRDANNTVIVTYPHTKEVTNYAKDSTINISPDRWGNLVVYVNGEDVVVMPKPFAIDAAGKRFEMDFELDRKAKTITVAGDLAEAKYPVTVDPTERVTNGGFETGNTSGWSGPYSVASSGGAHQGTYYLDVIGSGGYTSMSQSVSYTGATSVSNAVAIPVRNTYDIPMSDIAISGWHWLVNAPGQYVQNWTARSTAPGLTGQGNIVIWTYSSTRGYVDSVSVIAADPPVADFTGTPLSGTAPLTVQFTDQSTNAPTSWSWSFGDGGTSTAQNPSHQYTSAGTYSVSLTAANAAGSDGETKTGYVVVTAPAQTTFTVYADGVGQYHGFEGNFDLFRSNKTPVDFYDTLVGKQGNPYSSIHWEGIGKPVDDATGSRNWNINEDANSMANNADFAIHAGHGWDDGILFGTANPDYKLYRSNMQFGGNNGKAKWVAFFSCDVLNQSAQNNWKSVFNGVHILMAFDTHGIEGANQGTQFAQRMTGDGLYPTPIKIREAWMKTLQETIQDESIKGAYMWAEPSGEDYLAGFGTFSEPVKDGSGLYTILWDNFICKNV